MRKIAIVCCLLAVITVHAQNNTGIQFEHDSLSTLLAKAKTENKLIFIDCYTSWCGPCAWMAKNVFTNDTVAEFYNKNFINLKIDMEDTIIGKFVAKKYEVWCYPTYLFIDGDGNLVHRFSSSCKVAEFINLGKDALDPAHRFGTLQNKYESKTITLDECLQYIQMRKATCLTSPDELTYYLNMQHETDFSNRTNWNILHTFNMPSDSRLFQYLLAHRTEYDTKYGIDSVGQLISTIYIKEIATCFPQKGPDTIKYQQLRSTIEALHLVESEKIILIGDLWLFYKTKDWDKYAKTAVVYVNKYIPEDDFETLNNMAWNFYEHIEDQNYLDVATTWIQMSLQVKTGYFNTDTYAGLLYKRGKYDEALFQVNNAIELANKEGIVNYDETKALKKDIEKALQKEK